MDKALFDELLDSSRQAVDIAAGRRAPTRRFEMDAPSVRDIREQTGLSQEKFARLLHIPVATLRNWEQGRRRPHGPAAALLVAIRNDPQHVVAALNQPPE